jgi:putative ABC transport system permease protein
MIKDFFVVAVKNLKHRKLRSLLTALGVVISIASLVALLAISGGLQTAIKEQFTKLGSDRLFVFVEGGEAGVREGLTKRDVETIEDVGAFKFVIPYLFIPSAKFEYNREEQYSMLSAWPAEDKEIWEAYDLDFKEGAGFRKGQKNVAVFGSYAAEHLFDKKISARNKFLINGRKFEVVGVLKSVGNKQDDSQIYIPLDTARDVFNKPTEVSFIEMTIKPGEDINAVAERVQRKLERQRKNDDLNIFTPMQILRFLNVILGAVQGILLAIAAVSLIVGAVGILNSMYTGVLERTKEIGIMKSVGATNKVVMSLFLAEAGMIGLVGGILGVVMGYLLAFGVGQTAAAAGFLLLKVRLDPVLIMGALLFATLVGMVSGVLPARQAARLHPVDALRWVK